MLAKIRYGDHTRTVNLNCKCGVILEHIRKCGNYESGLVLDLSDKDGNVRLLRQNNSLYANSFLTAGETYFLVSAHEDPKQSVYALLVKLTQEETAFDLKPTKAAVKSPLKPKKGGK
jgi:hypothetical protein